MRLDFTPEELAFREEVREFAAAAAPDAMRRKVRDGEEPTKDEFVAWQRTMQARGWAAPSWPREHGGTGWTLSQRHIFEEEMAAADCPQQAHFGLSLIGPVLYTFGDKAQRRRHLPGILSGDVWWCQGYSERQAGSDLAALQTHAVRDGDDYVVNGHKIWVTYAHWADMMFALVRTSREEKRQRGISMLLIPMDTKGVTVRPIETLDRAPQINEITLDDVRVPVANRVGAEGSGWGYGKFLLARERGVGATQRRLRRAVERLRDRLRRAPAPDGRPLAEDPLVADRLAQLEIEVIGLEVTVLRVLAELEAGREPDARSSMLKIRSAELLQRITEMAVEASGAEALPFIPLEDATLPPGAPHAVRNYLYTRATTIFGGSAEIQRNVIARQILGL